MSTPTPTDVQQFPMVQDEFLFADVLDFESGSLLNFTEGTCRQVATGLKERLVPRSGPQLPATAENCTSIPPALLANSTHPRLFDFITMMITGVDHMGDDQHPRRIPVDIASETTVHHLHLRLHHPSSTTFFILLLLASSHPLLLLIARFACSLFSSSSHSGSSS